MLLFQPAQAITVDATDAGDAHLSRFVAVLLICVLLRAGAAVFHTAIEPECDATQLARIRPTAPPYRALHGHYRDHGRRIPDAGGVYLRILNWFIVVCSMASNHEENAWERFSWLGGIRVDESTLLCSVNRRCGGILRGVQYTCPRTIAFDDRAEQADGDCGPSRRWPLVA
jgi:hypothetical protein